MVVLAPGLLRCATAPALRAEPARHVGSPFAPSDSPWPPPVARVQVPLGVSPVLGPAAARVTIVAWTDFTCLSCSFADALVSEVRAEHPDAVRVVWKSAPDGSQPASKRAARAALAAGPRFWELEHALFLDRTRLDDESLAKTAASLQLDVPAWEDAANSGAVVTALAADIRLAQKVAITHTPWLFVNGRSLPWPFTREELELVVEEELVAADAAIARGVRAEEVYAELTKNGKPSLNAPPEPLPAPDPACAPPDVSNPPLAYGDLSFVPLCRDLSVDAAMPENARERVRDAFVRARRRVSEVFAPAAESPLVFVCHTDACSRAIAGPSLRSVSAGIGVKLGDGPVTLPTARRRVLIAGVGPNLASDLAHEMTHAEFYARIPGADVPMWFREGIAASVGDAPRCRIHEPRAIDDLRRLAAPDAWGAFTNLPGRMRETYCQARAEVEAWGAVDGRRRLLELLDAVKAGGSFDALYGPLRLP